jgi:hypothetical protein
VPKPILSHADWRAALAAAAPPDTLPEPREDWATAQELAEVANISVRYMQNICSDLARVGRLRCVRLRTQIGGTRPAYYHAPTLVEELQRRRRGSVPK